MLFRRTALKHYVESLGASETDTHLSTFLISGLLKVLRWDACYALDELLDMVRHKMVSTGLRRVAALLSVASMIIQHNFPTAARALVRNPVLANLGESYEPVDDETESHGGFPHSAHSAHSESAQHTDTALIERLAHKHTAFLADLALSCKLRARIHIATLLFFLSYMAPTIYADIACDALSALASPSALVLLECAFLGAKAGQYFAIVHALCIKSKQDQALQVSVAAALGKAVRSWAAREPQLFAQAPALVCAAAKSLFVLMYQHIYQDQTFVFAGQRVLVQALGALVCLAPGAFVENPRAPELRFVRRLVKHTSDGPSAGAGFEEAFDAFVVMEGVSYALRAVAPHHSVVKFVEHQNAVLSLETLRNVDERLLIAHVYFHCASTPARTTTLLRTVLSASLPLKHMVIPITALRLYFETVPHIPESVYANVVLFIEKRSDEITAAIRGIPLPKEAQESISHVEDTLLVTSLRLNIPLPLVSSASVHSRRLYGDTKSLARQFFKGERGRSTTASSSDEESPLAASILLLSYEDDDPEQGVRLLALLARTVLSNVFAIARIRPGSFQNFQGVVVSGHQEYIDKGDLPASAYRGATDLRARESLDTDPWFACIMCAIRDGDEGLFKAAMGVIKSALDISLFADAECGPECTIANHGVAERAAKSGAQFFSTFSYLIDHASSAIARHLLALDVGDTRICELLDALYVTFEHQAEVTQKTLTLLEKDPELPFGFRYADFCARQIRYFDLVFFFALCLPCVEVLRAAGQFARLVDQACGLLDRIWPKKALDAWGTRFFYTTLSEEIEKNGVVGAVGFRRQVKMCIEKMLNEPQPSLELAWDVLFYKWAALCNVTVAEQQRDYASGGLLTLAFGSISHSSAKDTIFGNFQKLVQSSAKASSSLRTTENELFRSIEGMLKLLIAISGALVLNPFVEIERVERLTAFIDHMILLLALPSLRQQALAKSILTEDAHPLVLRLICERFTLFLEHAPPLAAAADTALLLIRILCRPDKARLQFALLGCYSKIIEYITLALQHIRGAAAYQLRVKGLMACVEYTTRARDSRGGLKARNRNVMLLILWLEDSMREPAAKETPGEAESRIKLAYEASKALKLITRGLKLAPEALVSRDDLRRHNEATIEKNFQVMFSVLDKFSGKAENSKAGQIVDNLVTSLGNLYAANIDIALGRLVSLGFHKDKSLRTVFLKIFTAIFLSSTVGLTAAKSRLERVLAQQELIDTVVGSPELVEIMVRLCPAPEIDQMALSLLKAFESRGKALLLVLWLLVLEKSTSGAQTALRLSTVTSRALYFFTKSDEALSYLMTTVAPVLRDVIDLKEFFTLEDSRGSALFQKHLLRLVSRICALVGIFPAPFRYVCHRILVEHQDLRVVGGFVFLKFICPAIVNSEFIALADYFVDREASTSFMLLARALQGLANGSGRLFAGAESFFASLEKSVLGFLETISQPISMSEAPPRQCEFSELAYLHGFLHENFVSVCSALGGDLLSESVPSLPIKSPAPTRITTPSGATRLWTDQGQDTNFELAQRIESIGCRLGAPIKIRDINIPQPQSALTPPEHKRLYDFMLKYAQVDTLRLEAVPFTRSINDRCYVFSYHYYQRLEIDPLLAVYMILQHILYASPGYTLVLDCTGYDPLLRPFPRNQLYVLLGELFLAQLGSVYLVNTNLAYFEVLEASYRKNQSIFGPKNISGLDRVRVVSTFKDPSLLDRFSLADYTRRVTKETRLVFSVSASFENLSTRFNAKMLVGEETVAFLFKAPTAVDSEGSGVVEVLTVADHTVRRLEDGVFALDGRTTTTVYSAEAEEIVPRLTQARIMPPRRWSYVDAADDLEAHAGDIMCLAVSGVLSDTDEVRVQSHRLLYLMATTTPYALTLKLEFFFNPERPVPADMVPHLWKVSDAMAQTSPALTLRVLHGIVHVLDAGVCPEPIGFVLCTSPWARNVATHVFRDGSARDSTAALIRALARILLRTDVFQAMKRHVWHAILRTPALAELAFDTVLEFICDSCYPQPELDFAWGRLVTVFAMDRHEYLCRHVITRLEALTREAEVEDDEPRVARIAVLVRAAAALFFNEKGLFRTFFADITYIVLVCSNFGPPQLKKEVYELACALVHVFTKIDSGGSSKEPNVKALEEFICGDTAKLIFGVNKFSSGKGFSLTHDRTRLFGDALRIHTLCDRYIAFINGASDRGLGSSWKSRLRRLLRTLVFTGKGVFQAKGLLLLGRVSLHWGSTLAEIVWIAQHSKGYEVRNVNGMLRFLSSSILCIDCLGGCIRGMDFSIDLCFFSLWASGCCLLCSDVVIYEASIRYFQQLVTFLCANIRSVPPTSQDYYIKQLYGSRLWAELQIVRFEEWKGFHVQLLNYDLYAAFVLLRGLKVTYLKAQVEETYWAAIDLKKLMVLGDGQGYLYLTYLCILVLILDQETFWNKIEKLGIVVNRVLLEPGFEAPDFVLDHLSKMTEVSVILWVIMMQSIETSEERLRWLVLVRHMARINISFVHNFYNEFWDMVGNVQLFREHVIVGEILELLVQYTGEEEVSDDDMKPLRRSQESYRLGQDKNVFGDVLKHSSKIATVIKSMGFEGIHNYSFGLYECTSPKDIKAHNDRFLREKNMLVDVVQAAVAHATKLVDKLDKEELGKCEILENEEPQRLQESSSKLLEEVSKEFIEDYEF